MLHALLLLPVVKSVLKPLVARASSKLTQSVVCWLRDSSVFCSLLFQASY